MTFFGVEEVVYTKLKECLSPYVKVVDCKKPDRSGHPYFGLYPKDYKEFPDVDLNTTWVGYGRIVCTVTNSMVYINFIDGHGDFHFGPCIDKYTSLDYIDLFVRRFCSEIRNNLYPVFRNKSS